MKRKHVQLFNNAGKLSKYLEKEGFNVFGLLVRKKEQEDFSEENFFKDEEPSLVDCISCGNVHEDLFEITPDYTCSMCDEYNDQFHYGCSSFPNCDSVGCQRN